MHAIVKAQSLALKSFEIGSSFPRRLADQMPCAAEVRRHCVKLRNVPWVNRCNDIILAGHSSATFSDRRNYQLVIWSKGHADLFAMRRSRLRA
jgi:hypothetical protein